VLSGRYATDADFREAIRVEAQAAARVGYPNLASVYDYGQSLDEAAPDARVGHSPEGLGHGRHRR
jgi:hypothetical protein